MNFSLKVKNEILGKDFGNACCKIAQLAGFLRTSGTIETRGKTVGFLLVSEKRILEVFVELIDSLYGQKPKLFLEKGRKSRSKAELFSPVALKILQDTGILEFDGTSLSVKLGVNNYVVENECCRLAFIKGAFLGSGRVTVPEITSNSTRTGYHLEFEFGQYATATEFSELLAGFGFFPKLIARKNEFVVYIKNAEAINDMLTLLGALKTSLEMTDIIIRKNIKNKTNRALNCEMSNMSKAINASIKDREAINNIEQTMGLSSLPAALEVVAKARLLMPDATLSELAENLNISKSCLSHRLRKINQISDMLDEKS